MTFRFYFIFKMVIMIHAESDKMYCAHSLTNGIWTLPPITDNAVHLQIIVKESDDGPKMKYRKPLLERPRRFRDAYVDHATALSRDKLEWQQSVPI